MNPRNTLILAVLAAALGGFIWFTELREGAGVDPEEAAKALFPGVEAADLTAISLETSEATPARLERSDAAWALAEPVAFPADSLTADGLASTLADFTSEAVFAEPEDAASYGLDVEPAVRFEAGDASYALFLGDKTPVGGNTYVRRSDDERVFAVSSWRVSALSKPLLDLRDRRVLDFDADSVTALRASWPGGAVALERTDDGWQLVEPLSARADAIEVEGLLSTLQFLRADGFEDAPGSDSETGLDAPAFTAELVRGDGDEPVRVAIGSSRDGVSRLARGRVDGTLYRVDEARMRDLPTSVAGYRFKQLSEYSEADVKRFDLEFASGERVEGTRAEDGWSTAPSRMAAGSASRLVSELSSLEAADIAADALGEAELVGFALNPPSVRVRVLGGAEDSEDVLAEVLLGVADPDRGIAAMRAGDPVVYWLDFESAEHLPVSHEAFQNRFVSREEPAEAAPALDEPAADLEDL